MSSAHKRRIAIAIALLFILILGTTIPYQQNLATSCIVKPATVWSLKQQGAGLLTAGLDQNLTGIASELQFYQLERPDVFDLRLVAGLREGAFVRAGDTLAILRSRGAQIRSDQYADELQVQKRKRDALLAGSREEEIVVAQQKMDRAHIRLESFQPVYERALALQDSNLISEARFEETEARYLELQADLNLTEAQLTALKAGAHPAEIRVADAEIERLKRLSDSNRELLASESTICAPFSGIFHEGDQAREEIFTVERYDSLVVRIQVPEAFAGRMEPGMSVNFTFQALPDVSISAPLIHLAFAEGDSIGAFATALIANTTKKLQPGMTGMASLPLGHATLFQRLFNHLQNTSD